MKEIDLLLIVTIILIITFFILKYIFEGPPTVQTEGYLFLANDDVNANACKKYYLDQYRHCVEISGGDSLGQCWAQVKPSLIGCDAEQRSINDRVLTMNRKNYLYLN